MRFLRTTILAIAFMGFAVACGGGNKTVNEPAVDPVGDPMGDEDVSPADDSFAPDDDDFGGGMDDDGGDDELE